MITVNVKFTTCIKLDAMLKLVLTNPEGKTITRWGYDYKVSIDHTDWLRYSPKLIETDYEITVRDLPDDYEVSDELSEILLGYIGTNGYFVGPGCLQRIKLSDIGFESES